MKERKRIAFHTLLYERVLVLRMKEFRIMFHYKRLFLYILSIEALIFRCHTGYELDVKIEDDLASFMDPVKMENILDETSGGELSASQSISRYLYQSLKVLLEPICSMSHFNLLELQDRVGSLSLPRPQGINDTTRSSEWTELLDFSTVWLDDEATAEEDFKYVIKIPLMGEIVIKMENSTLLSLEMSNSPLLYSLTNGDGSQVTQYSDIRYDYPLHLSLMGLHSDALVFFSVQSSVYNTMASMNFCLSNMTLGFNLHLATLSNITVDVGPMLHQSNAKSSIENLVFNRLTGYYYNDMKTSVAKYLNRKLNSIWNRVACKLRLILLYLYKHHVNQLWSTLIK